MNRVEAWLLQEESTHRTVDERVQQLLENIRVGAQRFEGETWDQANERIAEEFIADLSEKFPGRVFEVSRPPAHEHQARIVKELAKAPGEVSAPVVLVERQKLKPMARRTTSFNYIFTVPGRSAERLVLVAHYDTWRGPGADDNTTGEEITKQYLLDDLRATVPPALTHVYILAGSEECGLIGFTSQVVLALGLGLANMALTKGFYAVMLLGVAVVPLAKFRFGVSGSREYVKSMSAGEMALVKSVISVDSVGEGKMYIPDSSLGADFVRAFIPFEGYDALNDVLEEAAHLNGIRYNNFIAGGTTDHVSFLEVNSSLRDRLGDWLGCPRWLGCHKQGRRKIPAAALVSLCPGKAAPLVFGGKIHTPADTPDRVYPGPLAEAVRILDYWYHLMQGGARIAEPRDAEDYHYAQLYRVRLEKGLEHKDEFWLALKDAIEPNRRNINGLYRVAAEISGERAVCSNLRILDWSVHTRLIHQIEDQFKKQGGIAERVHVRELDIELPRDGETPARTLHFAARRSGLMGGIRALVHQGWGNFERFMGSNTFLTFFAAAFLLAKAVDLVMTQVFFSSMAFQRWFFEWFVVTLPAVVGLQLWAVLWLIGVKIPTMIDNNYRHLNKSDNLRSLRRVAH